jgi:hypothetical protein
MSKMTRHVYEAIAAGLKASKPPADHSVRYAQWELTVTTMAQHLTQTNPNFHTAEFYLNAGIPRALVNVDGNR